MKKLIKKYVKGFEDIIDNAKDIKKEYNNEEIRIGVNYLSGNHNSIAYYYYNPVDDKVYSGAELLGNSSNYSYKNIGDIEIIVYNNRDNKYIQINRIIEWFDEDMSYSDEYEEEKFKNRKNDYSKIQEKIVNRNDKFADTGTIISKCIECGSQYIVTQEKVEGGLITPLNDDKTEVICNCIGDISVEEFLNKIKDNRTKEKYEYYLLDYCGLNAEEDLFL